MSSEFDGRFVSIEGFALPDDIAIVGSSGRLKENPLGDQIDNHSCIVRFNRAPTDGWEEMVGSREDVRCMNNKVWTCREFSRGGFTQANTDFAKSVKDRVAICYGYKHTFEEGLSNIDESNLIGRMRVENTEGLKQAAGYMAPAELTIGMFFILSCVVSGVVPSLYGFDIEKERVRDHYWEQRDPNSPYHKPGAEKLFLRKLARDGLIVINE